MTDTEFDYRGHWIHIDMNEIGHDQWRASYMVTGQDMTDVAGRPISYRLVLLDAQRNARSRVDNLIERAAGDGVTVVLVGTSHYRFPSAADAAEARAWISWAGHDAAEFCARFPNGTLVAHIGGSQSHSL